VKISRMVVVAATAVAAAVGVGLAGMAALAGTQGSAVKVTEVEYKLTLSPTHLSPGKTTLVVVNKGKVAHSLSISGPGVKKRLIAGTITPGTSRSVSVVLKAGSYALWCPVPGHAGLGMKTTLKVGSAGTTGTGATTTTKSTWG
jgi:plastocyanin